VISKKIEKAFNDQINEELYSAYLYLAMSAHFADANLGGMSTWMRVQAQEEVGHAMKFFDHVIERDGSVQLKPIKGPEKTWKSPLDVFEAAYKHEQHITGRINKLATMALEDGDHASNNFLQWFVAEQVEEEATALGIDDQLKLIGKDSSSLFLLDRELGGRTAASGDG
jgi:ferritin